MDYRWCFSVQESVMSSAESSSEESDLSDNSDHESSSDEEQPTTAADFKNLGNSFYIKGDVEQAIELYSRAIEMAPTEATYWGNRSAAYIAVKKWRLALSDANKAIQLKPGFTKAHLRASHCHFQFGEFKAARDLLTPVLSNPTAVKDMKVLDQVEIDMARATELVNESKWEDGQALAMKVMGQCSEMVNVRQLLVECLIGRKRYDQARLICESLYSANKSNSDIIRLRGTILYYTGSVDLAINHFQQVLKYDPDHRKTGRVYRKVKKLERVKKQGNTCFSRGQNEEAIKLYSNALAIDPHNDAYNAKLYGNRGAAKMKLSQWEEAKLDCDLALRCNRDYTKVYQRRATCHLELEHYTEAIRDLEQAKKLDPNNEDIGQQIKSAQMELKKSKRKNWYKILAVDKRATSSQIKKGYRKLALVWHPDKYNAENKSQKDLADAKWKDIQEAYEILADDKQRRRYDSGADLMEQHHGGGGGFHPSQADIFNMMAGRRGRAGQKMLC